MKTVFSSRNDYIASLANLQEKHSLVFSSRLLDPDFQVAFFKMLSLNVDAVIPFISSFYSDFGRPAKNQIEILRSLVLMTHFRLFSPKKWVLKLKADPALAILSGFHPDQVPNFSSFFDFFNRFYIVKEPLSSVQSKDFFKKDKSIKPKNHDKLVNYTDEDTQSLFDKYLSNIDHSADLPECPFYHIFDILGVQFSLDNQVIPSSVIVGGDGTSLTTHASSRGHSIPDDIQNRRFSDVDADIGWDSDIQKYYFGLMLSIRSVKNSFKMTSYPHTCEISKKSPFHMPFLYSFFIFIYLISSNSPYDTNHSIFFMIFVISFTTFRTYSFFLFLNINISSFIFCSCLKQFLFF